MKKRLPSPRLTSRTMAWVTAVVAGVAVPAPLLLTLSGSPDLASVSAPAFTLALMGVGIIAAAATGLFWVGVLLALVNTVCVLVLALMLGMPTPLSLASAGLAMAIASVSFAARGALFAKTLSDRGWLMALFVVAGEGSVLLIAFGWPGVLPRWFLALLPAQWASAAIQSALTGPGALGAVPVLTALAGTAGTTLLAARLWLRRWPYVLMFTTWLALSALVYFSPAAVHRVDDAPWRSVMEMSSSARGISSACVLPRAGATERSPGSGHALHQGGGMQAKPAVRAHPLSLRSLSCG